MFDIGALELVLIGVVALLVVGPERLPKLARTAGLWMGHARRALASVKDEIDREIKAEELKQILRKQAESNPLESIIEEDGGVRPRSSTASASGGVGSTPRPTGPATPQPPATTPPDSRAPAEGTADSNHP
jgi:sec-independent protein translocase protein TatB